MKWIGARIQEVEEWKAKAELLDWMIERHGRYLRSEYDHQTLRSKLEFDLDYLKGVTAPYRRGHLMKGFQIHPDFLNNVTVIRLGAGAFRREFLAAVEGHPSVLAALVKPWNCRPPKSEWAVLRAATFQRDNYICQYCGARGVPLECDHRVPVSRGGGHTMDNLTTACRRCNQSKRAKTVEEWFRP